MVHVLLKPGLENFDHYFTECHFCFGPASSFFLQQLVIALCPSPLGHISPWGAHLPESYLFACSHYSFWHSGDKNTGVVCHFLLQWTTFLLTKVFIVKTMDFPVVMY